MKFQTTGNRQCDLLIRLVLTIKDKLDEATGIALDANDKDGVSLLGSLRSKLQTVEDYYMGIGEVNEKATDGAYVVKDECWICGKEAMFQYNYQKPSRFTCQECEQTYLRLLREGPMLDGFECAADVWAITTAAQRVKKPKALDEDIRYSLYRLFGFSADAVPPTPKVKMSEGTHLPNDFIETSTEDVTGEDNAIKEGKDSTEAG